MVRATGGSGHVDFGSSGSFKESDRGRMYEGSYTYGNEGPNSGTLVFDYDDGEECTALAAEPREHQRGRRSPGRPLLQAAAIESMVLVSRIRNAKWGVACGRAHVVSLLPASPAREFTGQSGILCG